MRDNTKRPEGIESKVSKLVGSDERLILEEVRYLLKSEKYYNSFFVNENPYGDGFASSKILDVLL